MKLTLQDITTWWNAGPTLTENNRAVEAAVENTISRDGTSPNDMEADLDLGGHRIINLAAPVENTDAVRLQDVLDGVPVQISLPWSGITDIPANVQQVVDLVDPDNDRILFWDDSAGTLTYLTLGANLSITGTTLNAVADAGGALSTLSDVDLTGGIYSGDRLVYDRSLGEWVPNSVRRVIIQETDCDFQISTAADTVGPWRATLATGTYNNQASEDGAPGIWRMVKGTGTAQTNVHATNQLFTAGRGFMSFEARIRTSAVAPNNSTVNAYLARFGFFDAVNGDTSPTVNIGWFGGTGSDGTVWRFLTRDASTATGDVSSTNYTNNTWYKVRVEIDADGATSRGYVDDVLLFTKTTNLPPVGTLMRPRLQVWTASGATSAVSTNVDIDYIRAYQRLTTSR